MRSHYDLQAELSKIENVKQVYWDPPESLKLEYPCIVVSQSNVFKRFANNGRYIRIPGYDVMVIDPDTDSEIYLEVLNRFKYCDEKVPFEADGLSHWPLLIYY